MNTELLEHFLPEKLLDHFDITGVHQLGDISKKRVVFNIYLEEKNHLPQGFDNNNFESKGFYPEKVIQDFPIRGKAVYLGAAQIVALVKKL